jgi:ketosteroid isomerase-like protein
MMMIRRLFPFMLVAGLACTGGRGAPASGRAGSSTANAGARVADSLALLRLHERAREAHLARRADWLVAGQADSLISVSRGGVSVSPRERVRANFQPYLDASTFQAWDDIVPPRIRISADGQMAYVVVVKRVHLTSRDSSGATETERTRFAWMSVYEKQGGEWRMTAIASTDRPDAP